MDPFVTNSSNSNSHGSTSLDTLLRFMVTTMTSIIGSISSSSTTTTIPPFPADYLLLQQPVPPQVGNHLYNDTSTDTTTPLLPKTVSPIPFPDWDYEIQKLQLAFWVVSIVWFVVVPYTSMMIRRRRQNVVTTSTTSTKNDDTTSTKKSRSSKLYSLLIFSTTITIVLSGWVLTMFVVNTFLSPYNNSYTARRVFQTPLLTTEECDSIVQMSHAVAATNVQQYQRYHPDDFTEEEEFMLDEPPYGWQKLRHANVPTTDLNLVTDPFTYEQQQYIVQRLGHVRMAPLLSRLYGIPIRSIQARDIFIVRYDGNSTSRFKLKKHTDGGDISFTIYLNTDFTGGGTQFWNRHTKQPFYLLPGGNENSSHTARDTTTTTTTPTTGTSTSTNTHTNTLLHPGQFSTFPSIVEHEGYPTTEGIRYILVGFLDIVRYDEDGITPTGLSIYASYLNWNWMLARISDAIEKWNWDVAQYYILPKLIKKYTILAILRLAQLLDQYTEHCMTMPLIQQEQLPEFIQVLEQSFHNTSVTKTRRSQRARWIEGQQKKAFVKYINNYFSEGDDDEEEAAAVDNKEGTANAGTDQPETVITTPSPVTTVGIHPPDDVVKK